MSPGSRPSNGVDSLVSVSAKSPPKPTSTTKKQLDESQRFNLPSVRRLTKGKKALYSIGVASLILLAGLISLRLAYADRIYPGVWGNGLYLGGLTKGEAKQLLDKQTTNYIETPIFISDGQNSTKLDLKTIDLSYDTQATSDEAFSQGRNGNLVQQMGQQISLLLGGGDKTLAVFNYDGNKLATAINPIYVKSAELVNNASLDYIDGKLQVVSGQTGKRLDLSGLVLDIDTHLRTLDVKQINAQTNSMTPLVDNNTIATNQTIVEGYVEKPLKLTDSAKSWDVSPKDIISWIKYSDTSYTLAKVSAPLTSFYYLAPAKPKPSFDKSEIKHYLEGISGQINIEAQDAQLTIEGDRATVFKQSRDGKKLDIDKSAESIYAVLDGSEDDRSIALSVTTTKASVNDSNIDKLGIKELLSEGVSYFPGSSASRLTNVRVGASRFNGVLLKPGDTFSFGALLGDVGPEQGYAKSYVILDGKQDTDYGGGLCQVSSTAYRAALLAGLPIVERHNHAFAVSYYTEPYGVPGVDATIYYPQVDFKFKNDTGAHILIQTEMKGTTLKFRFYGTKTKSGVIRGPQFITGSNDPNQPSKTVFWRDVVVNGQVTKTDTINTYYKSALDYPHVD